MTYMPAKIWGQYNFLFKANATAGALIAFFLIPSCFSKTTIKIWMAFEIFQCVFDITFGCLIASNAVIGEYQNYPIEIDVAKIFFWKIVIGIMTLIMAQFVKTDLEAGVHTKGGEKIELDAGLFTLAIQENVHHIRQSE